MPACPTRDNFPRHVSRGALGLSGWMLMKIIYVFLVSEEDS